MSKKSSKPNFVRHRKSEGSRDNQRGYRTRAFTYRPNGNVVYADEEEANEKPQAPKFAEQDTPKLRALEKDLYDKTKRFLFIVGYPSTGKTKKAVDAAVIQTISNVYRQFFLVRPVLKYSTGFLQGTLEEKMGYYTMQASEYAYEKSGISFDALVSMGKAKILPADALQGIRFRNKIVIIDEAQNIPEKEAFKLFSRVGEDCKLIVVGDNTPGQCPEHLMGNNILDYGISTFLNKPYSAIHSFLDEEDLLGDDVTKDIIKTMLPDFVNMK